MTARPTEVFLFGDRGRRRTTSGSKALTFFRNILARDKSGFLKTLAECGGVGRISVKRAGTDHCVGERVADHEERLLPPLEQLKAGGMSAPLLISSVVTTTPNVWVASLELFCARDKDRIGLAGTLRWPCSLRPGSRGRRASALPQAYETVASLAPKWLGVRVRFAEAALRCNGLIVSAVGSSCMTCTFS